MHVFMRDHVPFRSGGFAPPFRFPAGRRNAVAECGNGDHGHENQPHCNESLTCADGACSQRVNARIARHDHFGDFGGTHDHDFDKLSADFRKAASAFGDQLHTVDRAQIVRGLVK